LSAIDRINGIHMKGRAGNLITLFRF